MSSYRTNMKRISRIQLNIFQKYITDNLAYFGNIPNEQCKYRKKILTS